MDRENRSLDVKDWAKDPEYLALLRCVLETPADDAPRLIISDWLEEHDQQQRAEFIRLQIELANHYREASGESNQQASAQRRLWLHQQALARFPTSDDGDSTANERQFAMTCDWDRGFIHSIKLSCGAFLEHARELFLKYPITSVLLTDQKPLYEGSLGYTLYPNDVLKGKDNIPKKIFRLLTCKTFVIPRDQSSSRIYRSEEEALADLSNACVAYGRQLAELPTLTQMTVSP